MAYGIQEDWRGFIAKLKNATRSKLEGVDTALFEAGDFRGRVALEYEVPAARPDPSAIYAITLYGETDGGLRLRTGKTVAIGELPKRMTTFDYDALADSLVTGFVSEVTSIVPQPKLVEISTKSQRPRYMREVF